MTTTDKTTKKCYSYIRFSTVSQGRDGRDSLTRQTLAAKQYAETNGLEYQDQSFADLGISGFRSKRRDGLQSMLDAIESGAIESSSTIVIDGFDRLSRKSFEHTYDLIRQIVSTGVKLHVVQDNLTLDKTSLNDLVSVIRVALQSDLAHKESAKKSYLIKASRTRAREAHKVVSRLPMWLKRSVSDGVETFVFNDRLPLVKLIVELRKQGKSLQSISKELNNKKYTTSTGAAWSGAGVRSILENRALYGAKSYHDTSEETGRMNIQPIEIVSDLFPSVCDFETWQSLQQKSKSASTVVKKVSKKGAYSGLLRCGCCNAALVMRTSKYKGQARTYRKCIKATEGSCQQVELIREPEKYLDRVLRELTYVESEKKHVSRVPELQEQIATLQKTEEILLSRGLAEKLADLYIKIDALKADIENEQEIDLRHTKPIETSFARVIEIKDIEHRNMVLRRLLKQISFTMIWKHKTASKWNVVIEQLNGMKTSFVLNQKHGFGNTLIEFVADAQKWKDLKPELEEWE